MCNRRSGGTAMAGRFQLELWKQGRHHLAKWICSLRHRHQDLAATCSAPGLIPSAVTHQGASPEQWHCWRRVASPAQMPCAPGAPAAEVHPSAPGLTLNLFSDTLGAGVFAPAHMLRMQSILVTTCQGQHFKLREGLPGHHISSGPRGRTDEAHSSKITTCNEEIAMQTKKNENSAQSLVRPSNRDASPLQIPRRPRMPQMLS